MTPKQTQSTDEDHDIQFKTPEKATKIVTLHEKENHKHHHKVYF